MQLKVARQIKQAARDLASDNQVKLLEDYSSPATSNKPTAAISVFNFALFLQAVAQAAIQVAHNYEESASCGDSDWPAEFVEGLADLRQETVGFDTVIY